MARGAENLARTITLIALVISVMSAISVPTIYFVTASGYEAEHLQEEAKSAARNLSAIATLNPRMWPFQVHTIGQNLALAHRSDHATQQHVMDLKGRLDEYYGREPDEPTATAIGELYDGPTLVGHVEITESVRHVWIGTAAAVALGVVLGLAMFIALRVLPMRALRSALSDVEAVHEQLVRSERLSSIGQVTATVSHELRNPLGAIRSGIDVIKKFTDEAPPHMTRAVALIDRAEGRCNAIITDLLDFTRVRDLDRSVMAVDDWMAIVLDEYVPPPGLSLRRELNADVSVDLDHERLRRVVENIIDNACQALDGDGDGEAQTEAIAVTTRVTGDRLEITIGDNGPGIARDDLERVFEPLFTTKSIGVGLGLPMVRQIMDQHGGGVEITSESGRGTRVVLWLPL